MRWALNYDHRPRQIVAIAYEGTTLQVARLLPGLPAAGSLRRHWQLPAGAYDVPAVGVNPAKAQAIFEAKGYTKNGNGYYEKDGKVLSLDIATNEAFIEKQRIAAVLVEQFQRAGINASTRNEAASTWVTTATDGQL
jgi:peptide/nickel transport system substrate-binding protein